MYRRHGNMEKAFAGKAGIITGGNSGIGKATARMFAQEGAGLVLAARRVDKLAEVIEELRSQGTEAYAFPCDVTDEAQAKALVDFAVEKFGKLDFAFNNAGANGVFAPITDVDSSVFDMVMKVNVYGVYYCLKYEIAAMQKTGGGAIVNTSSGAGLMAVAVNTPYNTSKFAVIGLTKSTAYDFAKDNIRVNALCPGSTHSDMMDNAIQQNGGAAFEEMLTKTIPMGALAEVEDQANAVVWLCSDKARMITGISLPVDGGYVLGK